MTQTQRLRPQLNEFSIRFLSQTINCHIPEGLYIHGTFPLEPVDQEPDAKLEIIDSDEPITIQLFQDHNVLTMQVRGASHINVNHFRSYIGLIMHYLGPSLFVHGCGLFSLLKQKGILIIGQKKSGKSTIAHALPHVAIMDDDQMLLMKHEIVCIGAKSAETVAHHSAQNVVYERSTHLRAPLGAVLILNKKMPGGEVQEQPLHQVLKHSDLIWHHNLEGLSPPHSYLKNKLVPDMDAFWLGTDGNKGKTMEKILKIIDDL